MGGTGLEPATFSSDAQGNQVKRVDPDNRYTLYFFGMYEVHLSGSPETDTVYYPGAGAVRVTSGSTDTLYYGLIDHLARPAFFGMPACRRWQA